MSKQIYLPVLLTMLMASCYRKPTPVQVTLINKSDTLNILQAVSPGLKSQWPLPYPVYRFVQGDITGDGKNEILVGVIKHTRFDTVTRKRLFIFKLTDGYIRPLWLGSRVAQPLVDFTIKHNHNGNVIRTIEEEKDGSYLVAEYKWRVFGIKFIRYINRNLQKHNAIELLNHPE